MIKNLFVTGYRANELQIFDQKHKAIPYIKKACRNKLIPIIEEGLEWVITSGQYGFDLWATEVAIELRDTLYPELRISMITAFQNQEENWNEAKKEYYEVIQMQLDHSDSVSHSPYQGPWQFRARDQLLFRKSDGLMLFYDEETAPSHSKYIKEAAIKMNDRTGYPIFYITVEDIQSIIEEEQMNTID